MASVKVKFRPSSIDGKEGSIYYQVIHNRVVRQIKTGYRISKNEWDEKTSSVKISELTVISRWNYLQSVWEYIRQDTKRLKAIIVQFDTRYENYTADDVVARFNGQADEESLSGFMQGIIDQLKRLGKTRTSETYSTTLNSFMGFRNRQDVLLCEVDDDMMQLYDAWLKAKGICPNTVSFYMRILRAVYNRAVEKGLTEQRFPFKHVYTGIGKTVKRAVSLEIVKRIKELDLTLNPRLEFARDMFLFSFYTRGMSFIDMAYFKKSDLKNGILTYRRRKTGQQLVIKWEKCMKIIVAKYGECSGTQYLLPIICSPLSDERKQYKNAIYRVNTALKEIAKLVGWAMPLTMYCARHGWASIAKSKGIPISVISEGMGHDSEETTRIYLASLETSIVDKANSLILNGL